MGGGECMDSIKNSQFKNCNKPSLFQKNLRFIVIFIFVIVGVLVSSGNVQADCRQEASQAQKANALKMAIRVMAKQYEITLAAKKNKQDFKVAIIGRMGTDPGSLVSLKDEPFMSIPERVERAKKQFFSDRLINQEIEIGNLVAELYGSKDSQLKYSHVGFLLNNPTNQKASQVIHELKPCKGNDSTLFDQGLATFFIDNPYDYGAVIMVPNMEIQNRLYDLLTSNKPIMWSVHDSQYNLASLPFQVKYQNSNQWVLELLAMAQSPRSSVDKWYANRSIDYMRTQIQTVLAQNNYTPTQVHLSGYYTLAKTFFAPEYINLEDQNYLQYDLVELITVYSIQKYMQRNRLLWRVDEVYLQPSERFVDRGSN